MRIIKPSLEIIEQGPGLNGIYKQIEIAGRECYASTHKIGEDTARGFSVRMITSGHGAMLEHGTIYLKMPLKEFEGSDRICVAHGRTHAIAAGNTAYVTTNYRVLVERNCLDLLKYMCDTPLPEHELRVTARFNCQIAISREYNRHRVDSIAEQSTRYCNYSKDKYGNEIAINMPSWLLGREDEVSQSIAEKELAYYAQYMLSSKFDKVQPDKKWADIDYWLFANLAAEWSYMRLTECGWSAQQARTVLPLDTNTVLVHTAFVSDWQHFFDLRSRGTTGAPHPDAKLLADKLLKIFMERGYIDGSDK